jgi:hypothetical protein
MNNLAYGWPLSFGFLVARHIVHPAVKQESQGRDIFPASNSMPTAVEDSIAAFICTESDFSSVQEKVQLEKPQTPSTTRRSYSLFLHWLGYSAWRREAAPTATSNMSE